MHCWPPPPIGTCSKRTSYANITCRWKELYRLHVNFDPSNRLWDPKQTHCHWTDSRHRGWRCSKVKAQRVISPTHPVCDSPNKHSCCWLIAYRHRSSLYTLAQYSKYTTEKAQGSILGSFRPLCFAVLLSQISLSINWQCYSESAGSKKCIHGKEKVDPQDIIKKNVVFKIRS